VYFFYRIESSLTKQHSTAQHSTVIYNIVAHNQEYIN
jgi:hypothetical protein